MKIDISNIGAEIARTLTAEYVDAQEKINTAAEEITKELVQNLKADSPKRTGKYAKGWTVKRVGNVFTAHNKKRPSFTHILENGHLTRRGKRVSAKPHIAKNEQKANSDFEQRVKKILEGDG